MYFDALTLAGIAAELEQAVLRGRVQRVVQPSDLSVGLELYTGQRQQLLLSAEPQRALVLLSETKLRRGREAPSPLQLLLVKYVDGARLERIEQVPLERVLRLRFQGPQGEVELIAELMGRHSNLILVGADGVILDALKRIPPSLNRYRTVLPHQPYVPPPIQQKLHPLALSEADLAQALAANPETALWRRLVEQVTAISPLLAREITYRAFGDAEWSGPLDPAQLAALRTALRALLSLPETQQWSPCLAFEDAEHSIPLAYAAYELTHLPEREPAPSLHSAVQRVLATQVAPDPYRQVRLRLHKLLEEQLGRATARVASLERALASTEQIASLKAQANAILAMAWAIQPGQRELSLTPEMAEGLADEGVAPSLLIPLDPALSAAENAQALFERYRKLQAASEEVPALLERAEQDVQYLRQLQAEVDLAEDRPQLDDVEQELRDAGAFSADKPRARARSAPLRLEAEDGTPIYVGRNSRQNDEVTFRLGAPEDLWLHAHGVPGAHVIIKSAGRPVAAETLERAAQLAAHYSAARGEARVQVDYTPRRHVRHIRGARPGMVTYREEQTLVVTPEPAMRDED